MVQILPYVPSFADSLSKVISEGAGQVGAAFKENRDKKSDEAILANLGNAKTPLETITAISKLSPARQQTVSQLYSGILKEQAKGTRQAEEFGRISEGLGIGAGAPASTDQPTSGAVAGADMGAPPSGAPQRRTLQDLSDEKLQEAAGYSASESPQARILGKQAEAILRAREAKGKELAANKKLETKEREFAHTQTSDYAKGIRENYDQSREIINAVKVARAALKSGKTGANAKNLAYSYLKDKESPLKDIFLGKDPQSLMTASKSLAGGFRQLFGAKPSASEFFWYENILPGILKNPETNEASLSYFEKIAKVNEKVQDVADEITKANGGYRPIDLDRQVRDKLRPEMNKIIQEGYKLSGDTFIKVKSPNGKIVDIPASQLDAAISTGGSIVE